MCMECVKREYPDRDTVVLESGAYFANFLHCANCKKKDTLQIVNKIQNEEENGNEEITYQHTCKECNHVIADHDYKFAIEDEFQVYEMECRLCGVSEDTRSIMPTDPRQQPMFY